MYEISPVGVRTTSVIRICLHTPYLWTLQRRLKRLESIEITDERDGKMEFT